MLRAPSRFPAWDPDSQGLITCTSDSHLLTLVHCDPWFLLCSASHVTALLAHLITSIIGYLESKPWFMPSAISFY